MANDRSTTPTPFDSEAIAAAILVVRGRDVILDRDLAAFYRVKPIALRQAVKRNRDKFPEDFMFQLTAVEADALVSQSVIPSRKSLGGALPYVFTEHGALQLSSVLRSPRATQVGLFIVRAFVHLRRALVRDLEFAERLLKLEATTGEHGRVLQQLRDAARHFITEQAKIKARIAQRDTKPEKRRRLGFRQED